MGKVTDVVRSCRTYYRVFMLGSVPYKVRWVEWFTTPFSPLFGHSTFGSPQYDSPDATVVDGSSDPLSVPQWLNGSSAAATAACLALKCQGGVVLKSG